MAKLKISYPSFQQPRRVTFGTGSIRMLADLGDLDQSVLFLSGQDAVSEVLGRVLAKRGHDLSQCRQIRKPPGEPDREMIRQGAEFFRQSAPKRLIAVGGGSVLDWARLAWAHAQGLLDLDTGRVMVTPESGPRPETWLIPTTCATGAEAASVAVYSDAQEKRPVVTPLFLADHVVLDGQFLKTLDPCQLARSLSDAASHAIESYVSIVPGQLAKRTALSALEMILEYWPSEESPSRYERLMEAAYLGGVAASNCSVGVVHALAHTLGPRGFGHGYANAVGLLAGIEANAQTPAMVDLARRATGGDVSTLCTRLEPLVSAARERAEDARLAHLLRSQRESVLATMGHDVCLRSNPEPLSDAQLEAMLDQIATTLESS
jgi:alcohol dehydrogenase class IV